MMQKKPMPKKELPVVPAKKPPQPIMPPRGMRDLLPADQPLWEMLRAKCKDVATAYGFERIDTPIVEETALFVRGIGRQTDIVEKEMYSFETSGNEKLTLRPEGTAPIMRASVQPTAMTSFGARWATPETSWTSVVRTGPLQTFPS